MIEYFYKIKKAEPKYAHVKVLILDEAQDSSVIQRKAEEEYSMEEGTCGYSVDGKPADKPAGPHLIRKAIRKEIKKLMNQ